MWWRYGVVNGNTNGLLSHKFITGIFKSGNYVQLLKDTVFPI